MIVIMGEQNGRLTIPVHYDFASTLCYVAHRVVGRIADRFGPDADGPQVDFVWTPIDLAGLLNWKRGARVEGPRLDNVKRVMRELSVPARVPDVWLDSRKVNAAAVLIEDPKRGAAWRERVFTAIFEEGRACDTAGEFERLAADLALHFDMAEIERGLDDLEQRTRAASEAMVTGVPTFMLAEWPMGGIQDDETMVSLITRFAQRRLEKLERG